MREIKFRAWDKNLKEIIPVYDIKFEGNVGLINTCSAWRTFDEIELMQFTGLLDSQGIEIYEGDLCTDGNGIIQIVWSDNHQWCGKVVKTEYVLTHGLTFPLWQWDKCERNGNRELTVVGNIYKNPELIKKDGKGVNHEL